MRGNKREHGLSIVALVIVLAIVAAVAAFGFKITPAWIEYWGVKKAIKSMSQSGELAKTPPEIRAAFDRHAEVGYLTSITGKDLQMTKTGNAYTVSFGYRKEIPVVANMSVVFDFAGDTGLGSTSRRARVD
jgi:Domain of unknown function (DUF4845)